MKSNVKNASSGIEITAQGHLLTVNPFNHLRGETKPNDAKRGTVTGFSAKSRKRLLETLARLETPAKSGYRNSATFLTLTTRKIHHMRDFKVLMFTWLKRLKRKAPRIAGVWRTEYQKRGAPHAHLILYNCPYVSKDWIQTTWGEVVDQDRPFTRIERVKSYRHVMGYASKYIAKLDTLTGFNILPYLTDEDTGEIISPGRLWGVYNREALPYAESEVVTVPLDGAYWLIRRYCAKLWSGLNTYEDNGFTIFCDNPHEHLRVLQTTSNQFIAAADSS